MRYSLRYGFGGLLPDALAGAIFMAFAVLSTLAANVVIGRTLKPSSFGIYALVITCCTLLSIPLHLGAANLVVRQTAVYSHNGEWRLLNGLVHAANTATLVISLILVSGTLALKLGGIIEVPTRIILLGGLIVPFFSLCSIRSAILRGMQRPLLGLLPEQVVRPLIALLVVLILATVSELQVEDALLAYLIGAVVGTATGIVMVRRVVPRQVEPRLRSGDYAKWGASWLTFTAFAGLTHLNSAVGIIALGVVSTTREVGGYKAIAELSMLITFLLSAINLVIAPKLARLFKQDDAGALARILVSAARMATLAALPLVLVVVLFGDVLVTKLYGSAYSGFGLALSILAFGQMVNAMGGSVGLAANMSGNEKLSLIATAVALVVNIFLAFALVPKYGATGAATAAASALALWNAILVFGVRRATSINCSIFGGA